LRDNCGRLAKGHAGLPGAGRPKGSPNKATREREQAIAASGLTPLDFMLQVMRDKKRDVAVRLDAAERAAPYVHPKLSAIMVDATNRLKVEVTVEDRRRRVGELLSRAFAELRGESEPKLIDAVPGEPEER
jgi:hypothetical protein